MADKKVSSDSKKKVSEPKAGEGVRSLSNWQRLATARQAMTTDVDSRTALQADHANYLQQFGVDPMMADGAALSGLEEQLMNPFEYAGHDDLRQSARRGLAAAVVAAGVAVVIGAVGAKVANVAVHANAALNANAAANANATWNYNWNAGVGGDF